MDDYDSDGDFVVHGEGEEESDYEDNDDDNAYHLRSSTKKKGKKPKCSFGDKCYRKNPEHFKEFSH